MSKDDTVKPDNKTNKNGAKEESWMDTIRTLGWAFAIALVIRSFFFEPFNIPSGSMIPTLLIGDYMFVNKTSYGYSKYSFPLGIIPFEGRIMETLPERGDVAVFRHPKKTDVDFVKRIVGLPGDKIQVVSGVLHINGEAVKRKRIEDYVYQPDMGNPKSVRQYIETLPNGVEHPILETNGDTSYYDNTHVVTVPAGHFFAMGDNRDNSNDSRGDVKFVPMENLVGKASFFFYSIDATGSLWNPFSWPTAIRYSRLFNGID